MIEATEVRYLFTNEEFKNFICKSPKTSTFHIHVRLDAPIDNNRERVFADSVMFSLTITRKQAEGIGANDQLMTSRIMELGGRIPVCVRKRVDWRDKKCTAIWIG
jgi:hypothetical protein